MATNFFERQDQARRNTGWLTAMYLLAVVGIVASVFAIATVAVWQIRAQQPGHSLPEYRHGEPSLLDQEAFPWQIPLAASGAALALIVGGTLFKVLELRAGGGTGVAERLGGRRLSPDSRDPDERKLLNVVEEMAIASGVPVPPVFLLPEAGINAFAAGYSPSDAVLGITHGAVEQLSRDELQGVIAHEFSHILNGDMRMSIRLIGILHGILLLGLVGQIIIRSSLYSGHSYSRSRDRDNNNGKLAIILIGAALIALGFIGSFFGRLIKAAVSRQREYLADASAVQFTRNPDGIAGALKTIGGYIQGSRLQAANAAEASHMYFAQGVWEGWSHLMATHPPLEKRIRAIDPQWDGQFARVKKTATAVRRQASLREEASPRETANIAAFAGGAAAAASLAPVQSTTIGQAIGHVGLPQAAHQAYAAELIASLPSEVRDAAHNPFGARAVIYCLLLDRSKEIRRKQVAALQAKADTAVLRLASQLQSPIAQLDPRIRLPLVDLTLPALRSLSRSQYETFDTCVRGLVEADGQLGLFEWTLGQLLARHLAPNFRGQAQVGVQYYAINRLGQQCSALLSTLAHVGHSPEQANKAFQSAVPLLPEVSLQMMPRDTCSLPLLGTALDTLATVAPKHRGRIVDACTAVICADGQVTQSEGELLRGIADLLDCPVPPLVAGQETEQSLLFAPSAAGASAE